MSHNDDTYMKNKMLLHLHEQYAVNNNAKLSSAVTLIVGLLAVIGAYGYVFLHVDDNLGCLRSTHEYTLDDLILTAMAAIIVLAIMKHICIYQGFAQRRDQFIIYAIRCYHGLKINNKDEERIFPDNYHPFNKEGVEIFQGLFGEFIKICSIIQIIIILSLVLVHHYSCGGNYETDFKLLLILVFVCCLGFSKYQQYEFSRKYKKLCHTYKKYKVENNNIKTKECIVIKLIRKSIDIFYKIVI